MKIAMVSDAIYPYNKGGKERKIFEIATRIAAKGHEVHIYTMKWWKEDLTYKEENGLHLHAISPLFPLYSGKRRSFKEAILFSLYCFSLIKEDFDVIDIDHMPHLVIFPLRLVTLLKRKKMIVSWNEVWGKDYWRKYIGNLGYVAYIIEKISVALPEKIISISALTTEKLSNEFNRKENVYTIPMGISYEAINNISPSKESFDIIFAGRLLENKNVDVLIKAIVLLRSKRKSVRCLIIGNGPERATIEALCKKYNIQKDVTIIDFLPESNQLYSLIKASKVFAFPSTREGFGIVVLEAHACGIPVITINHKDNASRNLITQENGITIPLDVHTFAEALLSLFNKPLDKEKIKASARKYDWDAIANKTLGVYLQ